MELGVTLFDNFMVSSIYNIVIIAIYIMGAACTLFTVFRNCDAREILTTNNVNKKSLHFSDLTRSFFLMILWSVIPIY